MGYDPKICLIEVDENSNKMEGAWIDTAKTDAIVVNQPHRGKDELGGQIHG